MRLNFLKNVLDKDGSLEAGLGLCKRGDGIEFPSDILLGYFLGQQ